MAFREIFSKTGFLNLQRSKRSLKIIMALLALFLIIPILFLLRQTYSQLEREAFYVQRDNAESLTLQIDQRAYEIIRLEEERKFEDYSFLYLGQGQQTGYLRLSPLANIPPITAIPGVIGYFQIEPDGSMSSPILPEEVIDARNYGISREEYSKRIELIERMKSILTSSQFLSRNVRQRILQTPAIPQKEVDAIFDETAFDEPALKELESALSAGTGKSILQKKMPKQANQKRPKISDLQLDSRLIESPEEQALEAKPLSKMAHKRRPRKKRQIEVNIVRQRIKVKDGVATNQVGRGKMIFSEPDTYNSSIPENLSRSNEDSLKTAFKSDIDVSRPRSRNRSERLGGKLNQPRRPRGGIMNTIGTPWQATNQILSFKGEMDPFQFTILDSGEVIFYRRVWRDEQRYIQGFVLDRETFLRNLFEQSFLSNSISKNINLIIAFQGGVIKRYEPEGKQRRYTLHSEDNTNKREILLLRSSLSPPFNDLELLFTVKDLPNSPGEKVVSVLAIMVLLILLVGLYFIYKLALNQLEFAKQRSDFVSAVSHELKTPLTSIRMYGEMLRDGYVTDTERQKGYFDFIYFESERLSRLISNVLQLAKMSNEETKLELHSTTPKALLEFIQSKVKPQVEANKFKLSLVVDEADAQNGDRFILDCENDAVSQIFINLIDNAIKFSKNSGANQVDIGYRIKQTSNPEISFFVRD